MWEYEAEFVVSAFVSEKGYPISGDLFGVQQCQRPRGSHSIIGAQFEVIFLCMPIVLDMLPGLGAEAKRDSTFWQLSCEKSA